MDDNNEKILMLNTGRDNILPFKSSDVTISIDGGDFIFTEKDGTVFKIPLAAQFASFGDNAFSVTFADNTHLFSQDLLAMAIKNRTHQDINHSPDKSHEKVIIKTVVEKVEVTKHDDSTHHDSHDTTTASNTATSDDDFESVEVPKPAPQALFSSSSSASAVAIADHTEDSSSDASLIKISQLQLATDIDTSTHSVIAGGGSRTDGSFEMQYGTQVIDLSAYNSNLNVDARINGSSDNETNLTRIMRLDYATEVTGVTADSNSHYHVVLPGSAEGILLGLAANEFAVVYATDSSDAFKAQVSFSPADDNGFSSYDLNFNFVAHPDSTVDADGNIELGTIPSPLVITGGNGNDTFIAGNGDDIYNGGKGTNTMDYSHSDSAITVDFQADNKSALENQNISDTDSATVTSGSTTQIINNFDVINGNDYDDTFITNTGNHTFHCGNGNNTFISYGGNNVFDGGDGDNTVDYRHAVGGVTFDEINLTDDYSVELNGVCIDLSSNSVTNNGWYDDNGIAGQDTLNNIHTVYGSANNDEIICDDDDDVIYGVSGDNYIIAGMGNDTIDGGTGSSTLDYSNIDDVVDIDLSAGTATKSSGGTDTISNIYQVIGSAGGGEITAVEGGDNILIGTGGHTTFNSSAGNETIIGGNDENNYNLTSSTATVYGEGNENILNLSGTMLNYIGSGSSNDTFVIDGGYSVISLSKGTTDINFSGSSLNEITSNNGGDFTCHVGDRSYNTYNLDFKTVTTLDYSSQTTEALDVNLYGGVISNSDLTIVDKIASGVVSKVIGSQYGHSIYNAQSYSSGIEFDGYGSNNTFQLGKDDNTVIISDKSASGDAIENNYVYINGGTNHIEFNSSSSTNIVDYSHTTGELNIDLNQQKATENGCGGSDDLIGVYHINGNSASNSTFKSADGKDCTFSIAKNNNAIIYGVTKGNDSFTIGSGDKLHYENLSKSAEFSISDKKITVNKDGQYNDNYSGNNAAEIYGTNKGDAVKFNSLGSNNNLTFHGGSGNNSFVWSQSSSSQNDSNVTIIGGNGDNTFTSNISDKASCNVYFTDSNDSGKFSFEDVNGNSEGGSKAYSASNISELIIADGSEHTSNLYWKTADHINVHYESGIANYHVNGGGNVIDGGNSVSYADYTSSGLTVNLDDGVIHFSDGRDDDQISNIYTFQGSNNDDNITGHSDHADTFYATAGNDTLNGNNSSGNVYADDIGCVNLDIDAGTVVKHSGSAAETSGTDSISNMQIFNFSGSFGGTSSITESHHDSNEFNLTANSNFNIFASDGSDNSIHHSNTDASGVLTLDYSDCGSDLNIDVTSADSILVDKGTGTDTIESANGETIVSTSANENFSWLDWGDLSSITATGTTGNIDLIEKSSGSADISITSLKNIDHINLIDISATSHTSVTMDITSFFSEHKSQSDLTIKMTSSDYNNFHLTTDNKWTHTSSTDHEDVYTDTSNHTFHISH